MLTACAACEQPLRDVQKMSVDWFGEYVAIKSNNLNDCEQKTHVRGWLSLL
jgi:hypothetical protein